MKKMDRIPTWEEMLEIEDKHPFSAGSLLSVRARVEGEAALFRSRARPQAARKTSRARQTMQHSRSRTKNRVHTARKGLNGHSPK
jgi:hypothetical protein